MRRIDQKSFGVDIDAELLDNFTDQYVSRGFKKYRTLEGAMRLWISLPNEIQAILISDPDYDSSLLAEFLGRRLREALSKCSFCSNGWNSRLRANDGQGSGGLRYV